MDWNYCPTCSHRIYQHHGEGCAHLTQVHHIASFKGGTITIKHPLAERERDKLFDCTVLAEVQSALAFRAFGGAKDDLAVIANENGGWSFEPVDKATQLCDCPVIHAQLVHT